MADGSDQTSTVEDLGSVGDWRLPLWAHRIPGPIWLFAGLAIADLPTELVYRNGVFATPVSVGLILSRAADALPILLPGLILARADWAGRSARGPLLWGSLALSLSILISTIAAVASDLFLVLTPDGPDMAPIVAVLRIGAVILGLVGPILLGRSIIQLRREPAPRVAVLVGVGILAMTTVYLALVTWASVGVTMALFEGAFDAPFSGVGLYELSGLIGGVSAFGWAYFAWAIVSGAGDRAGRPVAWIFGLGAVITRVASLAAYATIQAIWFEQTSTDPTVAGLASSEIIGVFFTMNSVLFALGTILLVAAFATGLGSPRLIEPDDAERLELDPLPSPG